LRYHVVLDDPWLLRRLPEPINDPLQAGFEIRWVCAPDLDAVADYVQMLMRMKLLFRFERMSI